MEICNSLPTENVSTYVGPRTPELNNAMKEIKILERQK